MAIIQWEKCHVEHGRSKYFARHRFGNAGYQVPPADSDRGHTLEVSGCVALFKGKSVCKIIDPVLPSMVSGNHAANKKRLRWLVGLAKSELADPR
jgi:hypothetical protein